MAHFRGLIVGSRGQGSRLGGKKSGMHVEAQSWQGRVLVTLSNVGGVDYARISLAPHNGAGTSRLLYYGPVSGELDESRIEYTLEAEPETISPEGNASAIDDETDAEILSEIYRRLDAGDIWAWCSVKVTATHPDLPGFEGVDYLGGCNYADEEDFKKGGYWEDMKAQAREDLLKRAND